MAWMPRSPRVAYAGLVWLPRLIDKARREAEGRSRGVDLTTPYMFGDNDYLDAKLLAFLKIRDRQVLQIVTEEPHDDVVAALILAISRRSPDECRRWSERFLKVEALWLLLIDIDEDRVHGTAAEAGRWFYNKVLIPPVFGVFRWMERQRSEELPTRSSNDRVPTKTP